MWNSIRTSTWIFYASGGRRKREKRIEQNSIIIHQKEIKCLNMKIVLQLKKLYSNTFAIDFVIYIVVKRCETCLQCATHKRRNQPDCDSNLQMESARMHYMYHHCKKYAHHTHTLNSMMLLWYGFCIFNIHAHVKSIFSCWILCEYSTMRNTNIPWENAFRSLRLTAMCTFYTHTHTDPSFYLCSAFARYTSHKAHSAL